MECKGVKAGKEKERKAEKEEESRTGRIETETKQERCEKDDRELFLRKFMRRERAQEKREK